jgi:glycosyltransferase involved in cell wall biosynthesis
METLVIDDCSQDQTCEIVRKFKVNHLIINDTNSGGPNKGRNIGLKLASGDYICFLDHDDTWQPTKVKYQLSATSFGSIVTCGYKTINTETGVQLNSNVQDFKIRIYKQSETFLKKLSKEKKDIQQTYFSTIMIANHLKHTLFEEHFGMVDYDWLLRLFHNQTSVELNANLVVRHVGSHNLSLNHEYRIKDYYYSLMTLEHYSSKYSRQVSMARKRINGSRARYYYLIGNMTDARKYLLQAKPGIKELIYYVTSFIGSSWVKRKFQVFG